MTTQNFTERTVDNDVLLLQSQVQQVGTTIGRMIARAISVTLSQPGFGQVAGSFTQVAASPSTETQRIGPARSRSQGRRSTASMSESELKINQYIQAHPGANDNEIAQGTHLRPNIVSRMLTKLGRGHYVHADAGRYWPKTQGVNPNGTVAQAAMLS